jgi:cellulose synthase/poly-beta-1,6-N-acetylglucosamine synthase-like glycosyltransferase
MQFLLSLISGVILLAALLLLPVLHFVLVAVNFVVHCGVLGMQLILSRFPSRVPEINHPVEEEPFVSIHVPTHNEPPEVVMQTLQSLSKLEWSNFEVMVIDNNTSDPALWIPVQEYCEMLGDKFRFFHVEGLKGFKAGAMNYVRQFMDRRAKFIFVVDADYVVQPHALQTALRHFTNEQIGLIQFPQDYRNVTADNLGIALDYKHFFSGFMNMANRLGCVPSTGTLALVNVAALESIGGFDAKFVTEDADLGLKLALKGYKSIYVNQTIGAGLLPH